MGSWELKFLVIFASNFSRISESRSSSEIDSFKVPFTWKSPQSWLSKSIYCWLGTDCSQPTLQSRSIKITLFPSFTTIAFTEPAKKYSNHVLDNFLSIFLMHTPKHPPIDIIRTILWPESLVSQNGTQNKKNIKIIKKN